MGLGKFRFVNTHCCHKFTFSSFLAPAGRRLFFPLASFRSVLTSSLSRSRSTCPLSKW